MPKQNKNLVFMVRPAEFYSNPQTLDTNAFQSPDTNIDLVHKEALAQFDALVVALREAGIRVHLQQDDPARATPDSIFPNNWVSFHHDVVHLYPMCSPNRRAERSKAFIENVFLQHNKSLKYYRDFSFHEQYGRFLEGTGSLVFDHVNLKAYACLSERTHPQLVDDVCQAIGYQPITFEAVDADGQAIYHTNVMMSVGQQFAVVCEELFSDVGQCQMVVDALKQDGKAIINISYEQMEHFCGNILQLATTDGTRVIAMSTQAFNAFSSEQQSQLSDYGEIVHCDISTIEKNGGGSVRCMICEVE